MPDLFFMHVLDNGWTSLKFELCRQIVISTISFDANKNTSSFQQCDNFIIVVLQSMLSMSASELFRVDSRLLQLFVKCWLIISQLSYFFI